MAEAAQSSYPNKAAEQVYILVEDLIMRFLRWLGIGLFLILTTCDSVSAGAQNHDSSELSTICQFISGPRAGTTFDFQPYGVKPLPVGHPCTDFQGNTGIAGIAGIATASAASREPSATPAASQNADLSTICQFSSGPRAGTIFDFQPYGVKPIPIGHPCTDFQGSNGIAGPPRNLPKHAGLRPVASSYQ